MMTKEKQESVLLHRLPKVRGRFSCHVDLSKSTWFQVGGAAEVVFKPADIEDLCFFLKEKPQDIPVTVIGVGSNLLVRDGGIPGVVIKLSRGFTNLFHRGTSIDVGAGVLDRTVALVSADEGVKNLEFLCGVPGTVGGALRMNAGCYGGEIKDILEVAFAVDPFGKLHTLTNEDMGFTYRHCAIPEDWIFVGARFKGASGDKRAVSDKIATLLAEREETQPIRTRTGGSTFANPEGKSAWRLIDQAGCRGLVRGGAQISEKHCNFMINVHEASAEDLEELGEEVRQRVLEVSGIQLEWEIRRLGLTLADLHREVKAA